MADANINLFAEFVVANASANLKAIFIVARGYLNLFAKFSLKTGSANLFAKFLLRHAVEDLFAKCSINNINQDWAVDVRSNLLRVYYLGGGTPIWSTRMLYSYMMDTFDQQEYMDNAVPMSAATPFDFTMVNYYHISDEDTQYLKGGAIATLGWSTKIRVLKFAAAGYTRPFNSSIGKTVQGSVTGDTGTLLAFDNTALKWWIRMDDSSDLFDVSENVEVLGATGFGALVQQGSAWSRSGENLYTNMYTLGTLEAGTQSYVYRGYDEIPYWWGTGFIDVLIKMQEMGVLLPESGTGGTPGYVVVYAREYTDLYDWFESNLSPGGRQATPLATFNDPDNQTAVATVANFVPNYNVGETRFEGVNIGWVNGSLPFTGNVGQDLYEADPAIWWVIRGGTSTATAYVMRGATGAAGSLILGSRLGAFSNGETIDVCKKLPFDALTGAFTVGQIVTGAPSGASATIRRIDYLSPGTQGVLHVGPTITAGPFLDDDALTDPLGGAAVCDGGQFDNTFQATGGALDTAVVTIDKNIQDGAGLQPYNVVIDMNGEYMDNMYEYTKAVCRRDSVFQCFPSDQIGAVETYQTGEEYRYARATYTPVKPRPFGSFAGGVFFGARGIFPEDMNAADVRNYQVIDANNVTRDPPNLQSFIVSSLAIGDRVAIFPTTGDNEIINKAQYSMVQQVQGVPYIRIQEAIPTDTPLTGVVRVIETVTEQEDIYDYIDFDAALKQFNIDGNTTKGYMSTDKVYVPYMDRQATATSENVQVVYGVNRWVLVRVRRKGIIPFQIKQQFTATGMNQAAIRTTDTIVIL